MLSISNRELKDAIGAGMAKMYAGSAASQIEN